jgi:predicted 3-demethylubiquinone-9 3-methyltransferase (glyoxalase superfamily)
MQKITPFLWFDHQAEEAMHYYVSIFADSPRGGKDSRIVSIKRYPEGPLEGPMKGMEGKVLTGVFELYGQRFFAIDGGPHFSFTGAISLYVECDSQKEVDHFWSRLGAEGDPQAQECGWLKDRYGLFWQVIPRVLPALLSDPDPEKSGRVLQAMLRMKKIDIAGLERAFQGEELATPPRG